MAGSRNLLRAVALFASAGLTSCVSADVAPPPPGSILIRDVTVIPVDQPGTLVGRDVLIAGGRVAAIGPRGTIRRSAEIIVEGRGKYLIPGLWDMHAHALLPAEFERNMLAFRRHGVVGVRDLGSTLDELRAARQAIASRGDLPELVAAGPLLDGPRQRYMPRIALPLNSVEEASAAVRTLAEGGVDFLKIYNNLNQEQYSAIAKFAKERDLPFAGHVPFRLTVEQVSAAGQASIEHAGMQLVRDCIADGQLAIPAELNAWIKRGYPGRFEERVKWWARQDVSQCRALYQRMARRRTWVTPTLANEVQGGRWTTGLDIEALPPEQQKACRANLESINASPRVRDEADRLILDLVRELHQAGVPLLAGTDTPNGCLRPGASLVLELRLMVEAGLTPLEALRTATVNPAEFLRRPNEGVVRPGVIANLVLLRANPLENIANTGQVEGVLLRGKWVRR